MKRLEFPSRTVTQILEEKEEARQIAQQRLEEVPVRFAALVGQGVIGSQMAEDLQRIYEENEDGICPVADQIFRLLDKFDSPLKVGDARIEASLILDVNKRYWRNE